MDPALAPALLGFALVSIVTPGPNNVMLLASGATFGFRRTVPHMLGITAGLVIMALALGLPLARAFAAVPALETGLEVASVAYMLWLAWRIATAPLAEGRAAARPMTFVGGALFQWANPKAWAMVLGAVTLFAGGTAAGVLAVAGAFAVVGPPCNALWAALGQQMRRVLTSPARRRAFNGTMAAALVLSILPAVWRAL